MSVALDVQIKQSHTNTTTPFAKPPKKDLSRRTPWDDADPERVRAGHKHNLLELGSKEPLDRR